MIIAGVKKDEQVQINLPGSAYTVFIKEGILEDLGILMNEYFSPGPCLVVTDSRVDRLFGGRCRASLEARGWRVTWHAIRPGERSKSLAGAARLYDAAIAAGLDRGCPVVAFGGGVVGDLAGFAAATYLRGVPLVAVPTTLLAQVDSSVGGKTGVNHARGKNLIGVFHHPRLVVTDPSLLKTLPKRQFRAGLAEVLKYGLICEQDFCTWLEANWPALERREPAVLAEAVRRSVGHKAVVVGQDERETDRRRILNFGHTVGHALEAATGYRYYLHGEAVQAGMVAAVEISRRFALLDAAGAASALSLLGRLPLRPSPAGLAAEAIAARLRYDKKRRGERLALVLLEAPGRAVIREDAPPALIEEVIGFYPAARPPFAPV